MTRAFRLHDRLAADTHEVARWALCSVRLMNDANFPWLILVPQRDGLVELHDLSPGDLEAMTGETMRASRALQALFTPDKINVAVLGNLVTQLHVHVIARFTDDPAWPKPVWGALPARPYDPAQLEARLAALRSAYAED